MYFCDDLDGYGWCVRKGEYLNVGLGRRDDHEFPSQVRAFTDWLRATGRTDRHVLRSLDSVRQALRIAGNQIMPRCDR